MATATFQAKMQINISGMGTASQPKVRAEIIGVQGVTRAGDSHHAQATDYVFEITFNSGMVTKRTVRAVSARSAIRQLRDGCCGLVRFKLCAQRGTCYPY